MQPPTERVVEIKAKLFPAQNWLNKATLQKILSIIQMVT